MSGDRLVVNFAALQQAAQDITNALSTMESQLADCQSAAQPLVATWTGSAQEAYEVRQRQWTQAANDLSTMLREIKGAVEHSAQEFQATESRNVNLFQ